ncbi:MAG: S8 family peptidase [Myxococcota bacterium]
MRNIVITLPAVLAAATLGCAEQAPADLGPAIPELHSAPQIHYVIVDFDEAVTSPQRERLHAAGIELLEYLGKHRYTASAPTVIQVDALPGVTGLRPLGPEDRIHDALRNYDATDPNTRLVVDVSVQPDVTLVDAVDAVLALGDIDLLERSDATHTVAVSMPPERIAALANENSVAFAELRIAGFRQGLASARPVVQADVLAAAPYNYDGSGVTVAVYDTAALNPAHDAFGGRAVQNDAPGYDPLGPGHATQVAGIIAGDGTSSAAGLDIGMAPGAFILGYGSRTTGTWCFGDFYLQNSDIAADFADAVTGGADLLNCSMTSAPLQIGGATPAGCPAFAPTGQQCGWVGAYGTTARLLDDIVRGSLGDTPLPLVWITGNDRMTFAPGCTPSVNGTPLPPQMGRIDPPATSKNVIAVGAVDDAGVLAPFSNGGPTQDGRLKPDLVAPGVDIITPTATNATTVSTYTPTGVSGTSFAAPVVTGVLALMTEAFRASFGGADPLPSTLKAVAIHTAQDLGPAGPDFDYGYGLIQGQAAVDVIEQESLGGLQTIVESEVGQGETRSWRMTMPAVLPPEARVTLAWDDPSPAAGASAELVNDLDLTVIDLDTGFEVFPWGLDGENPTIAASPFYSAFEADTVNNVEQIVIDLSLVALAGPFEIRVTGTTVPTGPQAFSLVATPGITANCHLGLGGESDNGPQLSICQSGGLTEVSIRGATPNVNMAVMVGTSESPSAWAYAPTGTLIPSFATLYAIISSPAFVLNAPGTPMDIPVVADANGEFSYSILTTALGPATATFQAAELGAAPNALSNAVRRN